MKRMYVIFLVIVAAIIGLSILVKYRIMREDIKVLFLTDEKHTSQDLRYKGGLNEYEWIIITGEVQRANLEEEGYILPDIDFDKNYLILSRYKILRLYRKVGRNKCLGLPDGEVIFDKESSLKGYYYLYLMPKVLLSQGVG